ncbi:hypothetical protein NPS01_35020 [Nocardioides psychrotolerans]|uniref:WD40-like Beta Propeller Repeat n=1 Tax=Nocardioides psychrotolerans TaxID=1005945 RepID=A0A1I3NCX5_9ACTN|nr:hypothetical protein [Nocardioides psychrotolerans]GEP39839.1 hypothetical protein NPS01_35020 [Nocardioides psychrotolerans]SFJ06770.1 hypothetical protein SAMN05216561_11783 [Nocardioides psychrotolerans]
MSELRALFDHATDGIENPRLEQVALCTAQRRRTRRRGAAAAAVASTLVLAVAVVVGSQTGGVRSDSTLPAGPPGLTPPPPSATSMPSAPALAPAPTWDPRDVDDLPAAAAQVVAALPEVIDPPPSSPLLADDPVGSAIVAVEERGTAQVLGTDGAWRTVPLDGRYPRIALSPGGTRLAVYYYVDTEDPDHTYAVTVHDLATGGSTVLQPPSGFVPWDDTGWSFLDEDLLLLNSGQASYAVPLATGAAEPRPYRAGLSRTVDPDGDVLVSPDWSERNVLLDYAGATPREVSMEQTGRLARIVADDDTVVGTSYENGPFAVYVADRATLTPQASLPILDPEANYSNWGLGPQALLDDGTVLLRVAALGGGRATGFRLVLWDPADGALSVVSSTDLPVEALVVFASGLLRS